VPCSPIFSLDDQVVLQRSKHNLARRCIVEFLAGLSEALADLCLSRADDTPGMISG